MTDSVVKPQGTILIATSLGADSGLALVQGASGDEVHGLSGTFGIAGIGTDGKIRLLTADDLGAAGLTETEVEALLLSGGAPHASTHETSGSDELETLSPSVFTPSGLVSLAGVLTPSQITVNQDNYAPTNGAINTVWRLATDASRNISGISIGQTSGRLLMLLNTGSFNIVLLNATGSTAANQFDIGINTTMQPKDSMLLIYDGTISRWKLASNTPVSTLTPLPTGVAAAGTSQRPASATHVHALSNHLHAGVAGDGGSLTAVNMAGLASALPSASIDGRTYYETDTGRLKRDNGSAWVQIGINPSVLMQQGVLTANTTFTGGNAYVNLFNFTVQPGTYDISFGAAISVGTVTSTGRVAVYDGTNDILTASLSMVGATGFQAALSNARRFVFASATTLTLRATRDGAGTDWTVLADYFGTDNLTSMAATPVA